MEEQIEKIIKSSPYYTEVYIEKAYKLQASFDYKLRELTSGFTNALAVRVKVNNSTGASFTTNLKNWKETLNNAIAVAKSSPAHDIEFDSPSKQDYSAVKLFSKEAYNIDEEQLIDIGLNILNECESVTVQQLFLERSNSEVYFTNSNGINSSYKSTSFDSEIAVTKLDATSWHAVASRNIPDFISMARKAVEICNQSENPIKISTGRMDVILEYHALNDLISSLLVPALSADCAVENRSYYTGKLGRQVASKKFTLADDGTVDFAPGSYKFDSEGVGKSKTILIENGVLKNFISDWYSGIKLTKSQNVEFKGSTGNCETLLKRPSVSYSNFVVQNGRDDVYEGTSLLVHHLIGLHTANKVTGDFSVNCENVFLVNNGKITPVKNVMLSGNIFEMLKNIKAIDRTPLFDGRVITPKIKFSNVQVIA